MPQLRGNEPILGLNISLLYILWTRSNFPTHTFLPSLQISQSVQDETCLIMQQRLNMLLKLEEEREKSKMNLIQHQEVIKKWFDKSYVGKKYFQEGDLILKWDKANELK